MSRLLLAIGFALCAATSWGDQINFQGTPDPNGHLFFTFNTTVARTSPQGNSATFRFGWVVNKDTNIVMIGLDPDTLIALGIDSSQFDSAKIIIREIVNGTWVMNMSGSDPDSVYLTWHLVVPDDSATVEDQSTFTISRTGKNWDTEGPFLDASGDDIVEAPSAVFNAADTQMIFYATTLAFGAEGAMRTQTGTLITSLKNEIGGDNPFPLYIPVQEFKEHLAAGQFAKWAIIPTRVHDADGDNKAGFQANSDDAIGALQLDLFVYFTPPPDAPSGKRRKAAMND